MSLPDKPIIEYPVEWEYRVIGADVELVREVIVRVMASREHVLEDGNTSPAGRWRSVLVRLVVVSEEERLTIHQALAADPAVRLVM